MKVVHLGKRYDATRQNRKKVLELGLENAKKVGKQKENGLNIYNKDIGEDIVVGKNGLKHGMTGRNSNVYRVTPYAGELLSNAVRINYLVPRNTTKGGYILLAISEEKGTPVPVSFIVNINETGQSELIEFNTLYAMNAKKQQRLPLEAAGVFNSLPLLILLV